MEKRRAQLPQLKHAKDKLAYFSLDKHNQRQTKWFK